MSSLREKGIKALVVGPDSSETENKEASKGKYNLVFTSPEALFGSHRSTILTLKNKIEAAFIDEDRALWRPHRDTIDLVIILPIEYEVAFLRRGLNQILGQ